ncbi:MAG TPA: glycoside hydrolase family 2 TIM barrel-domain containing protein [Vicinamibacteria bacterium]|nr:glycoside hydrolase family 2 TIM barrel-domain containing protein [Vicinamibacteria bacterium]
MGQARRLAILAAAAAFVSGCRAATPARVEERFDDGWTFHRGDVEGAAMPTFDDASWRRLDLPHDWSIEDLPADGSGTPVGPFDRQRSAGGASTGWVVGGTGWYRKRFRLDGLGEDRRAEVRFDGVYMDAHVWLNGVHLGGHPYGYTAFAFDLTPHLRRDGENVLAVRVRNEGRNSRWYSGSGIYRHVWLTSTGELRIPLWGVAATTREVSDRKAAVDVAVTLENRGGDAREATVRVCIRDPDGRQVAAAERAAAVGAGAETTLRLSSSIENPRRWSPEHPALHRAMVDVMAGRHVVDHVETTFGIRTVEVDARRGLRINGEPTRLRGACLHHDNGPLGAAAFDRAEERRVETLKAAGFNAVRTAHNPPSPAFLDACDRLGLLVIDEAFDMWRTPNNPDDYHRSFDEWWRRDLGAMVRRDRNHPSVVLWSIGNEIQGAADAAGLAIARDLIDAVRKDDPTRPVTNAICHCGDRRERPWTDADSSFALLAVAGYNYQWRRYEADHERVPERVIVGTESFPAEAFDSWDQVDKHPWVVGDFVWTGWDYLGESGIGRSWREGEEPGELLGPWPWHIAGCGDIDILGRRKPQSYYREALWHPGVLYVAVHRPLPPGHRRKVTLWGWPDVEGHWTWPGEEGRSLQVEVYSSCERVRLVLNGRAIGEKPTTRAERHRTTFEAPYEPGELVAIGETAGRAPVEVRLRTAGEPARLRLTPDRDRIRADRTDLAYVLVEVLDAHGVLVPHVRPVVRVALEGPGELAALASADPLDTRGFRGPACTVYQGICQAVLRPTGPGTLTLRAEADGLSPGFTRVQAE